VARGSVDGAADASDDPEEIASPSGYHRPVALGTAAMAALYEQAQAVRWGVSLASFSDAIHASVERGHVGPEPSPPVAERYARSLHLADLALACACAAGDEAAWEHFVREHRPVLYRAADALDPSGGARDLADALYADLFGLRDRDGERQSLFRYFHGRSSLATWLRAVLSQRHVDRLRAGRRTDPLPDEESPAALATPAAAPDPDRRRLLAGVTAALVWAVSALPPRDRLRLGCYYAQRLTLAEIGRLLGEHEATVSRHLSRTRREIRQATEDRLRHTYHLDEAAIAQCFALVTEDPGSIDLGEMLGAAGARKIGAQERSS
jgi:RNA polymerase sigma-70 factor, ECF subfamily